MLKDIMGYISLINSEGVNGALVIGKQAMLSCVDGYEARIDMLLNRIGNPTYRKGGDYQHDIVSDFLNRIRKDIESYDSKCLDLEGFTAMAVKACAYVTLEEKYSEEFAFAQEVIEGALHFLETACPSLGSLQAGGLGASPEK